MGKIVEMIGRKFGRLEVESRSLVVERSSGVIRYLCRCECSARVEVNGVSLRSGATRSCGCLHREISSNQKVNLKHGKSKTRVYKSWQKMRERCSDEKHPLFHRYGGRGIAVCDDWQKFDNFYRDMGDQPTDRHDLDRIDNDRGYSPENCRWVTRQENCRNTSVTVKVEWRGETKPLRDWADLLGIKHHTLLARINRLGWPIERAMTEGVHR